MYLVTNQKLTNQQNLLYNESININTNINIYLSTKSTKINR